ncbi:hypothetical protein SERLA73DRAFT_15844, partial [Serpula lacrymans var. lacrymans S7.3]
DQQDHQGRTAATTNHVEVVSVLLDQGYDVNSQDKEGMTPLSYASGNGNEDIVKVLLARVEDVEADSKDRWGRTPLSYRAENGNEDIVKLLLAGDDMNVNWRHDHGRILLFKAAKNGHDLREAVVSIFLACSDLLVNLKDDNGLTPLVLA